MLFDVLLLSAGILGLWLSADRTVDGAEKVIGALGLPSFLFGAVFMSVSTGLPEIVTAVVSAFEGVPRLSAGDVIGSSFVNLTFVLGVSVFAARGLDLTDEDLGLVRDVGFLMVFVSAVLAVSGTVSFAVTGILLAVYGVFLYRMEHSSFEAAEPEEVSGRDLFVTLGGVGALLISARLMVLGAKGLGTTLGVPIEILGATVVAVGTGLPELAFELAAIRKGDTSLAVGDIFGSSLVNITLTLSVLGILSSPSVVSLLPVLVGVGVLGGFTVYLSRTGRFSVKDGVVLAVLFMGYLLWHVL